MIITKVIFQQFGHLIFNNQYTSILVPNNFNMHDLIKGKFLWLQQFDFQHPVQIEPGPPNLDLHDWNKVKFFQLRQFDF